MGRIFSMMAVATSAVSEPIRTTEGRIFNLQRCSVHDGPGIRTTVFLKGCPLRCGWCHNPEGIDSRPEMMISTELCLGCGSCSEVCPVEDGGAAPASEAWKRSSCSACGSCVQACPAGARELMGAPIAVSELVDLVAKDRPFFDVSGGGVTFSGGEPLAQSVFLEAALVECGRRGIHTAVDTCGFAQPGTLTKIAEISDLLLFDLKHMDPVAHERHTGVDNRLILDNLRNLSQSPTEVWVRLPIIPGFNDDDCNIDATGAFVASLPRKHRLFVLPYHGIAEGKASRLGRPGTFTPYSSPDDERVERVRRRLESFGLEVSSGGSS